MFSRFRVARRCADFETYRTLCNAQEHLTTFRDYSAATASTLEWWAHTLGCDERSYSSATAGYGRSASQSCDQYCALDSQKTNQQSTFTTYYPAQATSKQRGRSRLYPQKARFQWPSCRVNRPWSHLAHTRNVEAPNLCKYWDREPDYTCPAFSSGLAPDHPTHTRKEGECKVPDTRATGRRRKVGPVMGPAIPAAGDRGGRSRGEENDVAPHPAAASRGRRQGRQWTFKDPGSPQGEDGDLT